MSNYGHVYTFMTWFSSIGTTLPLEWSQPRRSRLESPLQVSQWWLCLRTSLFIVLKWQSKSGLSSSLLLDDRMHDLW